jgi:competence protein ComFC
VQLKKIKKLFLDILFPVECLGCGKAEAWLCEACLKKIPQLEFFYCPVCERKSLRGEAHQACQAKSYLNGLLVAADWQNQILKKAIHAFKYNFVLDLKQSLGVILIKKIKQADILFLPQITQGYFQAVAPVPLHKKRYLWRGFNQAEILADEVAKELSLPMLANLISRKKHIKPQVKKLKEERIKNMEDMFEINSAEKDFVLNKKILLIDDVATTGATMQAAAKALKQAGVGEVWGLALARG